MDDTDQRRLRLVDQAQARPPGELGALFADMLDDLATFAVTAATRPQLEAMQLHLGCLVQQFWHADFPTQ